MDHDSRITETVVYFVHHFELQYSGKIQIKKQPALFRNLQSFVDCSMERVIRYNFFIDLERIQRKLSSDYCLNICFSRHFSPR